MPWRVAYTELVSFPRAEHAEKQPQDESKREYEWNFCRTMRDTLLALYKVVYKVPTLFWGMGPACHSMKKVEAWDQDLNLGCRMVLLTSDSVQRLSEMTHQAPPLNKGQTLPMPRTGLQRATQSSGHSVLAFRLCSFWSWSCTLALSHNAERSCFQYLCFLGLYPWVQEDWSSFVVRSLSIFLPLTCVFYDSRTRACSIERLALAVASLFPTHCIETFWSPGLSQAVTH